MTQRLIIFLVVGALLVYGGLQYNKSLDKEADKNRDTEIAIMSEELQKKIDSLKIEDLKVGDGVEAVAGKTVSVNYRGTLENGTEFDSSFKRNQPFGFILGQGAVIQGWDLGVSGMKVGGKRRLTIPSDLAYGDGGVPGAIPGGATLIFEVELLGVK